MPWPKRGDDIVALTLGPVNGGELMYANVDRHSIAYRVAGDGDPLVLLHGFLCDSRCWRTQLTGLADQFRLVAWDAPGAGLSSDPPESFNVSRWAQTLAEFLDVIGVKRAHFVGLSWGGLLAQELYRLYAARVDHLILAGTYAGWKGSFPPEAVATRRGDAFATRTDQKMKLFANGSRLNSSPTRVQT